jgi:hypothetical protein
MTDLGPLVKVKSVTPLKGFFVRVTFRDGTVKKIDLEPFLRGPVFDLIRNDPASFELMKVVNGIIVWDNGADIDPDVLYYGLTPAWMEQPE